MKFKKFALMTAVTAGLALTVTSCGSNDNGDGYTYHTYTTALGQNWNPHAWESNAESTMLSFILSPLVDISIKDSSKGLYQWVYEMATEVTDVTAQHQNDLTKYGAKLPKGKTASEITSDYVYEIKLNEDAKWETGENINADTYIDSMKLLLDPSMKNYRANLYYGGTSALAGGFEYFYSQTMGGMYAPVGEKYYTNQEALNAGEEIFVNLQDFWNAEGYKDADGNVLPTWISITDTTVYNNEDGDDACSGKMIWDEYLGPNGAMAADGEVGGGYSQDVSIFMNTYNPNLEFDTTVGLYKVNDYTIRYVNKTAITRNYFLSSLTSNWIVHKATYENGFETTGNLKTTDYNTSADNTVSCGPYKLETFEAARQMVFTRNEYWYGYEENSETGKLESYTPFEVDGEHIKQYVTDKIVFDVLDDATAKQVFEKGELDEWTPLPSELNKYTTSDQLYKVDETYTQSFFFNTNVDALKAMDQSKGNVNSVVLSNDNFRKALSLSIDRADWVTASAGWKPAFALLNSLYYYDAFDNPESIYRNSEAGMKAIVNLYGVEYGEGKTYKTLEEAAKSINGYNLAEAKLLMKQACDELVNAGLYERGQNIKIRIGYKSGSLDSTDNAQISLMESYFNAALEGSGFGTIDLEAVGDLKDRYAAVPAGEFAIGFGAWGGAEFYPYSNFQLYMDPDYTGVNEIACWDPTTEKLTIEVEGTQVTMTYQKWSQSLEGTGQFANASFEVKNDILSTLETAFLRKYYRIPLASTTSCSMLSYKINYYTDTYNTMYGFGGFRLLSYNYNDAEWADYVESQGGTINYAS